MDTLHAPQKTPAATSPFPADPGPAPTDALPLRERAFAPVLKWMSERSMRYVSPRPAAADAALARATLRQARRDFFVGGPITVHAAAPRLMAGMWTFGREAILVPGALDRGTKEAIAAGVSESNVCPYCVDMHVSMTHAAGWHAVADAILGHAAGAGGRRAAVATWALGTGGPGTVPPHAIPFSPDEVPEAVGTALFFHYINRVVNVFFAARPLRLPAFAEPARRWFVRAFGAALQSSVARPAAPGLALPLLPPAALPDDLRWAAPDDRVAGALARWAAVVEAAAARHLHPEARRAVTSAVASWQGEAPPLGRAWCDDALRGVRTGRAAGELALMSALASHRVTPSHVARLRQEGVEDEALVATVAWGAFTAARRITGWLTPTVSRPATRDGVAAGASAAGR